MGKIMEGYTVPSDTRRHLWQERERAKEYLGDFHCLGPANKVRKNDHIRPSVLGKRAYS